MPDRHSGPGSWFAVDRIAITAARREQEEEPLVFIVVDADGFTHRARGVRVEGQATTRYGHQREGVTVWVELESGELLWW